MRFFISSLILSLIIITSCSNSSTSDETPPPPPDSYHVEAAFPNLSFNNPLDLQNSADGSDRLFAVEQGGLIKVFQNDSLASSATVFLDIQNKIATGGELGLLGLAFHPDFKTNGYFYVNYTTDNPLRTIISRFQVSSGNPNRADANSETIILTFNQRESNHNGGQLRFGPDGYLYIATGDGGGAGDPSNNAQNRANLLGNILRIDVDGSANGNKYLIPPGNPFADNNQGFREEIFAYGLRNPFRFSFDAAHGDLWAGDVGQGEFEEIDLIEKGNNYGWNTVEGNTCYQTNDCDMSSFTAPVFVYDHSNGDRSITGGFVYQGTDLKGLNGFYIYADFISGRIWALDISDQDNPRNTLIEQADFPVSSFGTDANNELYICGFDGTIYKLVENI